MRETSPRAARARTQAPTEEASALPSPPMSYDDVARRIADPKAKGDGFRCQKFLCRNACQKVEEEARVKPTVFTPHKSPEAAKG